MQKILQAESYRYGALGAFGDASYMLIAQHQFPDEYEPELDRLTQWDHDRIMQQEPEHSERCFAIHVNTGPLGLENWIKRAKSEDVIAFLKDILHADSTITWTGFRILGTIRRDNGYPVWTFELFGKHPQSKTVVYSVTPCLSRTAQHEQQSPFSW